MNGRKAKTLRRQAREETIGLPDRNYTAKEQLVTRPGKSRPRYGVVLGNCTRRRYKELKRA